MLVRSLGIQDIKLPFMKKSDLEKRKMEMKYAIGLFSGNKRPEQEPFYESRKLEELVEEVEKLDKEIMPRPEKKSSFEGFPKSEEFEDIKVPTKPKTEQKKPEPPKQAMPEPKLESQKTETQKVEMQKEDIFKKPLPTFYFWYCELKASNLAEFEDAIKKAPLQSIEHHASGHDFSNWLKGHMPEEFIASVVSSESKKGEELRSAILATISALKRPKTEPIENNQNNSKKQFKEPVMASI